MIDSTQSGCHPRIGSDLIDVPLLPLYYVVHGPMDRASMHACTGYLVGVPGQQHSRGDRARGISSWQRGRPAGDLIQLRPRLVACMMHPIVWWDGYTSTGPVPVTAAPHACLSGWKPGTIRVSFWRGTQVPPQPAGRACSTVETSM
jgi:hypothetical protein